MSGFNLAGAGSGIMQGALVRHERLEAPGARQQAPYLVGLQAALVVAVVILLNMV
jgi:hypothetical protein